MEVLRLNVRSILNRTKIRGIDYTINPYVGCAHNCIYCFAGYVGERMGIELPFGHYVGVKVNAREALLKDLKRIKGGVISISSVTDPYQPAEREWRITRSILEVLRYFDGEVSILTKSPLVLRDMDLLKKMKDVEVGFSIPILDESLRRILEPGAPPVEERIEAIKRLVEEGIRTWIFIAPYLPGVTTKDLEKIIMLAGELKVSYILLDRLNLYPRVEKRLDKIYGGKLREFYGEYMDYKKRREKYLEEVRIKFYTPCSRFKLDCRAVF